MSLAKKLVNDIVTVVIPNGEIIGRLSSVDGDAVELISPRLLVPSREGDSFGFAPGVCITGELSPARLEFRSYITITKTEESVAQAWANFTSSLVVPNKKLF